MVCYFHGFLNVDYIVKLHNFHYLPNNFVTFLKNFHCEGGCRLPNAPRQTPKPTNPPLLTLTHQHQPPLSLKSAQFPLLKSAHTKFPPIPKKLKPTKPLLNLLEVCSPITPLPPCYPQALSTPTHSSTYLRSDTLITAYKNKPPP